MFEALKQPCMDEDFPVMMKLRMQCMQSRLALGPTHTPIQWVPGVISVGVKRPGWEVDHSPPSSAKVKKARSCIVLSPVCIHKVDRGNFTLNFIKPVCGNFFLSSVQIFWYFKTYSYEIDNKTGQ